MLYVITSLSLFVLRRSNRHVPLRDEPDPQAYPAFALLPYVVRIDDGFRMVSAAQDNDAFIVAERDMPVAAAEGE